MPAEATHVRVVAPKTKPAKILQPGKKVWLRGAALRDLSVYLATIIVLQVVFRFKTSVEIDKGPPFQ